MVVNMLVVHEDGLTQRTINPFRGRDVSLIDVQAIGQFVSNPRG